MKRLVPYLVAVAVVVVLCLAGALWHTRLDLTGDHRYSLSEPTKQLVGRMRKPIEVTIYLDGPLNAGFTQLREATADLLDELDYYAGGGIHYQFVNPSDGSEQERQKAYNELAKRGITPTVVYDTDDEGNQKQIVVFPWAEVQYGGKSTAVCLLKNQAGRSGEDNLNLSIEALEYQFTDALRFLTRREVKHIAFLEGHGELAEPEVYDVCRELSRYFQIDRGRILPQHPDALDGFACVVIAGPKQAFTEGEKYVLDQYLMRGGRILWLVDGSRFEEAMMSTDGLTPAIALDLNLTDMLFHYGVRINTGLVQDEQCLPVPVNIAAEGQQPEFKPMPWYFAPLLVTSPYHPISCNLMQVSSCFASNLDQVGRDEKHSFDVILATSGHSHLIPTPGKVDLQPVKATDDYFDLGSLAIGVAMEGQFTSNYEHQLKPQEVVSDQPTLTQSVPTRQVVIANSEIIRNQVVASEDSTGYEPLPCGYDRYTGTQFGNRDLIVNAVLYLADDADWISLRSKQFQLRLLNKNTVRKQRTQMQVLNIGLPLLLLSILGILYTCYRRRRWRG